jgi:malate dehydrogenase
MKIAIIGAGNVGGLTVLRLAQEGCGDILLVDIVKGLAQGKSLDLEDAASISKINYHVQGTDEIKEIKDSDIIVITAGLSRKPGMTREDLLNKNAQIIKEICLVIKKVAPSAIVILVTNPVDLMTRLALEITGFKPAQVFGMGITLDAGRFSNLISQEFNIPNIDIDACVIGSHGEGMLPLPRFTTIKGINLDEFTNDDKIQELVQKTIQRGAQVLSLLGSGSAYFAPSLAVAEIVRVIAKDEKRILGVSAYLSGEYGIKDVCIGVPCRLGKGGIEKIIELGLSQEEKQVLQKCAAGLKEQYSRITI